VEAVHSTRMRTSFVVGGIVGREIRPRGPFLDRVATAGWVGVGVDIVVGVLGVVRDRGRWVPICI